MKGRHEDVGECQVLDQHVGDGVEPLVVVNGQDDQYVSCK